jgi:PA14 domain
VLALALLVALAQEPEPTFGTTVVVNSGLKGRVYHIPEDSEHLPTFEKLKPKGTIYTPSLNVPLRDFRTGFPGVTNRIEWFAIDYTGRFWIEKPALYRFSLTSDDGSRLYIDGQLVVDNDGVHANLERSASLELAGGVHSIRVSYFQGPRESVALVLLIAGPGEDYRVFNTEEFKPPPNLETWIFPENRHASTPVVAALEVPNGDVAGRALVKSAKDPAAAAALFTTANFPGDKQPDAVRRAYIEVQLQRLLERARAGNCGEVMPILETLGDEDKNLPFTFYGFSSFMKSAHFQYNLGIVESICGAGKAAQKRWGKLSRSSEPIDSADYVYPYLSAKSLGESNAGARIDAALQALKKAARDDSRPVLMFTQGALLIAAGKSEDGEALLRKSLRDGDSFVQYLSLTVLTEASRK